MIRNLVSAVTGGLVTFLFLLFWNATNFIDPVPAFAIAGLLAGIGGWFWPIIVGYLFFRRRKSRRDEQIQKEVDRQLSQKG
jgi:hypothetical protein